LKKLNGYLYYISTINNGNRNSCKINQSLINQSLILQLLLFPLLILDNISNRWKRNTLVHGVPIYLYCDKVFAYGPKNLEMHIRNIRCILIIVVVFISEAKDVDDDGWRDVQHRTAAYLHADSSVCVRVESTTVQLFI
jgi:hypothetical protein